MIWFASFAICFLATYVPVNSVPAQHNSANANATEVTEQQVQEAIEKFSFSFGHQLSSCADSGKNILFSPISLYTALLLLHLGAAGKTKEEISAALNIPTESSSTKNSALELRFYQRFNSILGKIVNATEVDVEIGNGVFIRNEFPINEQYTKQVRSLFDGEIMKGDFASGGSKTVELINKWISEKTKGRISQLFNSPFDQNTAVLLASTLYYSGTWEHKFDDSNTKLEKFKSKNKKIDAHFLKDRQIVPYSNNSNYQVVGLPYKKGEFHLYVVLPHEGHSLESVLSALNPGDLKSIIQRTKATRRTVAYKLPKLKYSWKANINEQLDKLGIKSAFGKADLSRLTSSKAPLNVSKATHAAEIEVNERGTVASAVTTIEIVPYSAEINNLPVVPFVVDRPFFFFIGHRQTNVNLFAGVVYNPTE